mmetsp:Transcript_28502/g.94585  ORF Transcript_28502/g.94585 Transcript_28502/m.94585 type:complete len:336 (-) Transcript_28502:496-1503(-)
MHRGQVSFRGQVLRGHKLAMVPHVLRLEAFGVFTNALAMLLAIQPPTRIRPAVWPQEGTLSALEIVQVASVVHCAIRPLHPASASHVAVGPLAEVLAAAGELVAAFAMHLVLPELALVLYAPVAPVDADAVLEAIQKLTLVQRSVSPHLGACPRLDVLAPLTLEGRAVDVGVHAMALLRVLVPLALVSAAVGLDEEPSAMRHVVLEVALVPQAVARHEDAAAVALVAKPLSDVPRTVLDLHLRALHHVLLLTSHTAVHQGCQNTARRPLHPADWRPTSVGAGRCCGHRAVQVHILHQRRCLKGAARNRAVAAVRRRQKLGGALLLRLQDRRKNRL